MSTRYPGGFITKNPVAPTSASASGIWTQGQVLQYVRSGTWPQVFVPIYIEDVFSTYLYTGTGSSQTITNNIDTSTKGGLVWIKGRSGATGHRFTDTVRGATKSLASNSTAAVDTESTGLTAFGTTGFTIGADSDYNTNAATYVSWTFREQAKFFDVVTYTGNGNNSRQIAHNLGSSPGFVIIKRTDAASDWYTFHRSITSGQYPRLNGTDQDPGYSAVGNPSLGGAVNSTNLVFASAGTTTTVNINNATYVAYLFAHDAGGFGATGTDNVISCGSFTTDGSGNATVSLGYEPQWLLLRFIGTTSNWFLTDNMRGLTVSGYQLLTVNTSDAESSGTAWKINSTGFTYANAAQTNKTLIYIAIRRGPMKTPTSGTSVFSPVVYTGTNVDNRLVDMSLLTDMAFVRQRNDTVLGGMVVGDRLRGDPYLLTGTTDAEVSDADSFMTPTAGYGNSWSAMNGFGVGNDATSKLNASTTSNNQIAEGFRRAPGFFDVVCYTGTGSSPNTQSHNLGVAPELVIVKSRTTAYNWAVWHSFTGSDFKLQYLNTTGAAGTISYSSTYMPSAPTASQIAFGTTTLANDAGGNYVAYLFATVAGVSKVGSYTGTGTTLQVDCGFTAGSRFVMIKRTDSDGDWYVWDSARGIVAGDDPYLLLNSTAAEVTNTDYVDTSNAGFEISSTAPAAINANGGTYIFLAIA